MIADQLNLFPLYQAGGARYRSLKEAALALGSARVHAQHALIRRPGEAANMARYARRSKAIRQGAYGRDTLLRYVRAVPPGEGFGLADLHARGKGRTKTASRKIAELGVAALERHIEASWNPDARHVVMHSSGYDSRLLSALLHRIASRRGPGWLGETKFVCFQPEIEFARAIFNHIGWQGERWAPVRPTAPAVDYYAPCLDFATMGANLSESERFWGGPLITQLELAGYLDTAKPMQVLTALFSDETQKWNRLNWGDIAWFIGCFWFDNPAVFPGVPECEAILPFASRPWLEVVTEHSWPNFGEHEAPVRALVKGKSGIDAMKIAMLRTIDPELAALPNFRFEVRAIRERNRTPQDPGRGHIDQQKISSATAQAMEDAYRSSWYATAIGPDRLDYQNDRTFVYWSDRNAHYMKAAIYEHLRGLGVTLSR